MKKSILIAWTMFASMAGVSLAQPEPETAPQAEQKTPQAESTPQAEQKNKSAIQDPSLASEQQQAAASQDVEASSQTPQQDLQPAAEKPERTATGVMVDVNVGTMGLGLSVGYEFNPYLKARLRGALLGFDYNDTWGDSYHPIDGQFEFSGNNIGLMVDYHPFAGRFRVTAGLNLMDLKVEGTGFMDCSDLRGEYSFGGDRYRVTEDSASVKGVYDWNRLQPYIGIGWSSDGEGDREIYFTADLGVNFIGSGNLKVSHSGGLEVDRGGTGTWTDASDADIESSLREEGKDFFEIADDLIVYPVLQIGVGGRF